MVPASLNSRRWYQVIGKNSFLILAQERLLRANSIPFAGQQTPKKRYNHIVNLADTFERSCDHWSEAGRLEMEDFYALASIDYRHLAEAIDWKAWLETRQTKVGPRCLRLLDVACGSGKFPAALASYAGIENSSIRPVDYALLDPSSFSISEARQALAPPFKASAEYEMRLQDLKCEPGYFDIVWATHALYAIPHNELKPALRSMVHAMGHSDGVNADNNGVGFIAHASKRSHYLQFFQQKWGCHSKLKKLTTLTERHKVRSCKSKDIYSVVCSMTP
jgi:SAM-dependent methyltransferase